VDSHLSPTASVPPPGDRPVRRRKGLGLHDQLVAVTSRASLGQAFLVANRRVVAGLTAGAVKG